MSKTTPVEDDVLPELIPLRNVIERIHKKRSEKGVPVFKDKEAFIENLESLVELHRKRCSRVNGWRGRDRRYQAVASAAQQLRSALQLLSNEEVDALENAQKTALHEYAKCAVNADEGDYHEGELRYMCDELEQEYKPLFISKMLKSEDLRWVHEGADKLCLGGKRGRQNNFAERWTAQDFAVLCHESGWSPIQVANSGTEKRDASGLVLSDAVICLAAVFSASGISAKKSISLAHSMLRLLRREFIHLEWPYGSEYNEEHEFYYDDSEAFHYKVSLNRMQHVSPITFEPLPSFVPADKD